MALPNRPAFSRPAGPHGRFRKPFARRKVCRFCADKIDYIDFKNINMLRNFISDRGKIRGPRITGACRKHQRQVAVAIKRAREMALLPYVAEAGPPSRSRSSERS